MTGPPPLIQSLLRPETWNHPTSEICLLETHISWIILTGPFAYKIKKPVDFGFLDFTTLEKRRFYCREELRLNRRLAEELYMDVVTFRGDDSHPTLGGNGPIVEYAVKMRQFDQSELLAEYARQDRLKEDHVVQLAHLIGHFHVMTDRATPESPYGEPEQIEKACLENFSHIDAGLRGHGKLSEKTQWLKDWTIRTYEQLRSLMAKRKQEGYVRECHGDLHLGNIVMWRGHPTPFDCIEFNPMLRWIDVISEIAFTVMDLTARGQRPLAFRFLNEYLTMTGDYPGLKLLRYYLVYRAMVRAKIAYLSDQQNRGNQSHRDLEHYLALALGFSQPALPMLLITHGFSGSGKSYASRRLAAHLDALHLRSDVERKRLAGLSPQAPSKSGLGKDIYNREFTQCTYQKLRELARDILQAEFSVIVDATFLNQQERRQFRQLAESMGVAFRILDFGAEAAVLRQRIEKRLQESQDPSEADLMVLAYQLSHHDPLSPEEQAMSIHFDTSQGFDLEQALSELGNIAMTFTPTK